MYGRPSKRMRRIKPVARVGAVDLNCRYDIHSQKVNAEKLIIVPVTSVMISSKAKLYLKPKKHHRNNNLHVLSCTNGLDDDKWTVAGVAVTGFSPRTDVYEQGFVIQVSGLTSIFNNSPGTINAGDNVYVSVSGSAPNPTGVPRTKQLLQLTTSEVEGSQLLGMCAKGGAKQSTIDIVLHRGGSSRVPSSAASSSSAESKDDNATFEEPVAARFRAGASVAKPKAKKSKSSK